MGRKSYWWPSRTTRRQTDKALHRPEMKRLVTFLGGRSPGVLSGVEFSLPLILPAGNRILHAADPPVKVAELLPEPLGSIPR